MKLKNQFSLHNSQNFSLRIMATLSNERKIAAFSGKKPETTRNKTHLIRKWLKSISPRSLERLKGGSLKKLSKVFSRMESHFLGALSKLHEFLLNQQVQTCSVSVPRTSSNNDSEIPEPTLQHSLGDLCPEAVFCTYHSGILSDLEQEVSHHMVAGVQEEIPYCSPGTSSGKQTKARSTNQPQFRSDKTAATIEADQILLALK